MPASDEVQTELCIESIMPQALHLPCPLFDQLDGRLELHPHDVTSFWSSYLMGSIMRMGLHLAIHTHPGEFFMQMLAVLLFLYISPRMFM